MIAIKHGDVLKRENIGESTTLDRVVRGGLSEEVTFELRTKGQEERVRGKLRGYRGSFPQHEFLSPNIWNKARNSQSREERPLRLELHKQGGVAGARVRKWTTDIQAWPGSGVDTLRGGSGEAESLGLELWNVHFQTSIQGYFGALEILRTMLLE